MLTQNILDALNAELTRERFAVAAYQSMAGVFTYANLEGFAKWAESQSKEEAEHAEKFFDYLCEQNTVPVFATLPPASYSADQPTFELVKALLGEALKLEQNVTEALKEIFARAQADGDSATEVFLHPFILEQVTAEHDLETMIGYVAAGGMTALLLLDAKLEKA